MVTAKELMRKDYVSIDVKDTISHMLGRMKKAKVHSAVVFDGKKYKGIAAKRFLLTSRIQPDKMKVGNITKKRSKSKITFFVPTLKLGTDIKEICRLMAAADTHMLPVIDKNKVVGVVSAHELVKEISTAYRGLACDELASMKVETASPDDQLMKIIQKMNRGGFDHVPLVDSQGKLTGMIAMADLIEKRQVWNLKAQHISRAASHQKGSRSGYDHGEKENLLNLPARNCMTYKTTCCTAPNTKIPDAIKIMSRNNVCNIVLVKYDKPVGILTIKDILEDYAK